MVACRLGAGVAGQAGGITKEDTTTLEGDGYVHGLECGDRFTGVCVCVYIKTHQMYTLMGNLLYVKIHQLNSSKKKKKIALQGKAFYSIMLLRAWNKS